MRGVAAVTAFEKARSLVDADGAAIRIRYVAILIGVSRDKVLEDGRRGEFPIVWQKCGTRRYAYIERADARCYIARVRADAA